MRRNRIRTLGLATALALGLVFSGCESGGGSSTDGNPFSLRSAFGLNGGAGGVGGNNGGDGNGGGPRNPGPGNGPPFVFNPGDGGQLGSIFISMGDGGGSFPSPILQELDASSFA